MKLATQLKVAVLTLGLGLLGLSKAQAVTGTADATITVTPNITVSLSIAPTNYAFGIVDLSSQVVSGSSITLTNSSQVSVSMQKRIQTNPANWTAAANVGADAYVLYAATSTFRPDVSDFQAGNHKFGLVSTDTALKGIGGGTPTLAATNGAVDLWFRLDTPSSVSTVAGQIITLRFTGTAL